MVSGDDAFRSRRGRKFYMNGSWGKTMDEFKVIVRAACCFVISDYLFAIALRLTLNKSGMFYIFSGSLENGMTGKEIAGGPWDR
jgi:hypothetical protein